MKSLLLLASLAAQSPQVIDVSIQITDFYDAGKSISNDEVLLTATDLETGDVFEQDQRDSLSLPVGTYEITGKGAWCFVVPKTVEISAETETLSLEAGCE